MRQIMKRNYSRSVGCQIKGLSSGIEMLNETNHCARDQAASARLLILDEDGVENEEEEEMMSPIRAQVPSVLYREAR
jgi:hypothetical protein